MARLKIVAWPDPVLTTPADPVTKFDAQLKKLVDNMFETMYAAPGVGLAATQVGIAKRLFVMDCSAGKDPSSRYFMANPQIILKEGKQDGDEGCLSIPGIYSKVQRSVRVIARGHAQFAGQADSFFCGGQKRFMYSSHQDITTDTLFFFPVFQNR